MDMLEVVMLAMMDAWWFWYGDRNADGSRVLEFADGLNLVIATQCS